MNTVVDQLTALCDFCKAVDKTGKLYFRVFSQFGDRQINVLMTPPLPSQPAG